MTLERVRAGEAAERRAAEFLAEAGYRILARRFRTRMGEVDLVAQDGPTVVFVEVKARSSGAFGGPEAAVDARKQSRIVKAALAFLQSRNFSNAPLRFDVVAVDPAGLRHIPDAFQAPGGYTR